MLEGDAMLSDERMLDKKGSGTIDQECRRLQLGLEGERQLVIAANRGPVTFSFDEGGQLVSTRRGGGLVTALTGLAQYVDATWIGSATSEADLMWGEGDIHVINGRDIHVRFVSPEPDEYDGYYNVISNPLLWFLQHNMYNIALAPTFDSSVWKAWEQGYLAVNSRFAKAIAEQVASSEKHSLIMLQDYQLYMVPHYLRTLLRGERRKYTITHFVHIPWPGTEDWGFLPPAMRRPILESLCGVDLLGFQTKEDGLNFLRSCESHLPRASTNYTRGRVWYKNHPTYVRDFPISIDVGALRQMATSEGVDKYREEFIEIARDCRLIVRVDRTEPSKNIVRGFQAFDEMLELHPEHQEKVKFLAILAPSRLEVDEYKNYLDETMAAAGRVNAKYGTGEWEPVRVIVGENYPRAIAAMKMYDVLLVNSIADGMNLVAKEGPVVNEKSGVVILSERTGARQQLAPGAMVISPCDVYATAEAMHQALMMSMAERKDRAIRLRWIIEKEDITDWLCRQLVTLQELNL